MITIGLPPSRTGIDSTAGHCRTPRTKQTFFCELLVYSTVCYDLAMELGLATFADLGGAVSPEQRMRDLLEEVELADQLGLDVFAIGEHHRPDFLVSSPAVGVGRGAGGAK